MKPFYLQDMLPFIFLTPNSCFKHLHCQKTPRWPPNVENELTNVNKNRCSCPHPTFYSIRKLNTRWCLRNKLIEPKKTYLWPSIYKSEFKFNCIAVTLSLEILERSTFSSRIDSKDSSFWGTNYDRTWFYDLSLQHPPTLCEKWRQQCFNSTFVLHLKADSHHQRIHVNFSLFWPCSSENSQCCSDCKTCSWISK